MDMTVSLTIGALRGSFDSRRGSVIIIQFNNLFNLKISVIEDCSPAILPLAGSVFYIYYLISIWILLGILI